MAGSITGQGKMGKQLVRPRKHDRPLKATNNQVFKALFGDAERTEALTGFLSAALGEQIGEVAIIDPELKGGVLAKHSVLDIAVRTTGGERIQVEMQLEPERSFEYRVTYGLCKLCADNLVRGKKYERLPRCISVVITDFAWIGTKAYRHLFELRDEKTHLLFTNRLAMLTLELPKVRADDADELAQWLHFLSAESYDELDELADVSQALGKAVEMLAELSEDERMRMIADAEEKAWRDEMGRLDYRYDQGVAKGMAEGIAKTAISMKADGLSLEFIAKHTGLAPEQIAEL